MAEPDELVADVSTAIANHDWASRSPTIPDPGELVDVIAPVVREFDERRQWIAADTLAERTVDAADRGPE